MEALFVKILNKSLVSICFVLLLGVLGTAGYALFLYTSAEKPVSENSYIKIKYDGLVLTDSYANNTDKVNGINSSNSDKKLLLSSMNVCIAENKFLQTVSTYSFKNINNCAEEAKKNSLNKYNKNALNYLDELTLYIKSITSDKNVKKVYHPDSSEEVSSCLEQINNKFQSLFDDEITKNNIKNAEKSNLYNNKIKRSIVYAISALSVFVIFLALTFFIVFIRVEKHVSLISQYFVKKQSDI